MTAGLSDEFAERSAFTALHERLFYAEAMPEAFGLSPSNVSRRFIAASARKLSVLQERDLSRFDLVAIFFDGKAYGDDEILLAVGVTLGGKKVILGMVQASSENEVVCRDFIRRMIDRGLNIGRGFCVSSKKRIDSF